MSIIPVRVQAALMPVLANERRFNILPDHPLYEALCPVCDGLLGETIVVLVFAGIEPQDRKPGGFTSGAAVAVHAFCAGVPAQEPETPPVTVTFDVTDPAVRHALTQALGGLRRPAADHGRYRGHPGDPADVGRARKNDARAGRGGASVTAVDEWDEDNGNPMLDDEGDGDWRDYDDDYREPDPEDHEIARAYEEEAEHRETVHGGGECTCRPTLRDRLAWKAADAARRLGNARARVTIAMRGVYTIRIGRAEFTLRLNANRTCGACGGQGWFYTLDRSRADDRPPGYNGTALCGCGSATAALAETRRDMRQWRKEPPF